LRGEALIVLVKYCGGCNSSYNRPMFVKRVQDAFPLVRFTFLDTPAPDFSLAVCGCPVACAARENVRGTHGRYVVTSRNGFVMACEEIRRAEALLSGFNVR
jgi:hypothetical protein